ncbi:3-hydroxyacyl-CoA dehydrogenase family protein [Mycobacteroides abscessus]|uniref:3-hydroxyacyl-CoA dehydrogenase family protein n=1 Tax=Mycobacteroides abscessus TaxID=36809 RepID=UPI000D6A1E97
MLRAQLADIAGGDVEDVAELAVGAVGHPVGPVEVGDAFVVDVGRLVRDDQVAAGEPDIKDGHDDVHLLPVLLLQQLYEVSDVGIAQGAGGYCGECWCGHGFLLLMFA